MTSDPPAPAQTDRSSLVAPEHVPASSTPGTRIASALSTPLGSSRTANSLSSKVSTVLSTSYADSDFRDALLLLDDRGIANHARTRRQLRLDLQREVITINGEIIDEFGRIADQLRRIGATVDRLNRNYSEMRRQVGAAHGATAAVLQEASSLMAQRRQVETKQHLLTAFHDHYVLSEDEVAVLTLTSEPIDERFFNVLSRAKRISKDCEVLLGFEDQTLGLELMERTSRNINAAFQKLFRWLQREFKNLNLENPRIGSSIRRALRVLAERPSLFQNCLDLFAEAREHVLSDAFYTALTGSSASGIEDRSIKPIELVAHDLLRYTGDMLAWTHSAGVSEREALEVLFVSEGDEIAEGLRAGREIEVWHLIADDSGDAAAFDPVRALNELVDRDMSGAARILRQRLEQVIQTNEDTILAYRLANLLNFYRATFAKLLGSESGLGAVLGSLEAEALRQFRSLVRDHIATLQGDFQHTPSNLAPPDFLEDALEQLKSIMKSYDTSLTPSKDREAEFQSVLTEALDPFVAGCVNMSKTIGASASSIFLINSFQAVTEALTSFEFTRRRQEELTRRVETERKKLVESQYTFFRTESGIDSILDALAPLGEKEEDVATLKALEQLQPAALGQASHALDDFLPSALMDAMENLKNLQDSSLGRDITEEAAERFCVDFEHIEAMLMYADELAEQQMGGDVSLSKGEFQSLRSLFPRTSGEIRVLLS